MNPTADGSVVVPAEFWELPITGEPVLLYTYSQIGFPYRTLSSSGNSIAYTKLNDDNSYSICLYQYLTKQDDCTSMAGEQIYTRNWSPDDEKYNFDIFNTILGDDSIHYESTYYIGSIFEPASLANEIDAYVWLAWIDSDHYIYLSEDWDLVLATSNGSNIKSISCAFPNTGNYLVIAEDK